MKYFVIFLILLGFAGLIIPNIFAELDESILEPFKNSDLVVIGKIIQVNTIVSENKTEYNIQVEEYLKNQKSFEMITAILDGIRPLNFPNSNPLDYYNKPYFEEGNQVLVYLKQEGGIYKMSPYSFTIEKKGVAGPPTVIHTTGPQGHFLSQGEEIVISGTVKKGYLYGLEKSNLDSSFHLVVLNERGEKVEFKKLIISPDGSYKFSFQNKGELRIPGNYSWEVTFENGSMGGEFVVVPDLNRWTPLKQIKAGIKFHNVECNEGLVLAQRGNTERSACVKLDTKIELTVRGWAYDDRIITGCLGDRVQKCYPEDKDEYRKALQHYYYGTDLEPKSGPTTDLIESFQEKYYAVVEGTIVGCMGHKETFPIRYQCEIQVDSYIKFNGEKTGQLTVIAYRDRLNEDNQDTIFGLEYHEDENYYEIIESGFTRK